MAKAKGDYTPEQLAIVKRMAAAEAEADKARKVIDRAQAIRDGQIAPPWAEQLIKATPKRAKRAKAKEGPKEKRINEIARSLPHGGRNLSDPEIVKVIGDNYQKQHKQTIHRTTILRSLGRLPRP
jgi:hypothetical protein